MNKVSACWIPKLLNPEQTLCRQHICEKNLRALADDEEFFSKIVTRIHAVGPQGSSTAKKGKNAEFIKKADGDGRNLTD
jgi:hypothetical protein